MPSSSAPNAAGTTTDQNAAKKPGDKEPCPGGEEPDEEDGTCPIVFDATSSTVNPIDANAVNLLSTGEKPPAEKQKEEPLPTGAVCVAFFKTSTCPHCRKVQEMLETSIKSAHPRLFVRTYSVDPGLVDEQNLLMDYDNAYNVPEKNRSGVPQVFIADRSFLSDAEFFNEFESYLDQMEKSTQDTIPCKLDKTSGQGQNEMVKRFEKFGVWVIVIAGLIDGLNPCAFATLIFLITGLIFMKRENKDILLVGFAFTSGIYITYLVMGMGLLKGFTAFQKFTQFAYWIYPITATIAAVFGIFSIMDFIKARRGKVAEMSLKLPTPIRKFNERFLRRSMKMKTFPIFAFIAGIIIACTEFLCTGQVYLPTIVYIAGIPGYKGRALAYLMLYNFLFIVPLILVFIFVFFGASSKRIAQLSQKYLPIIKLVTGVLFIGMAVLLFKYYTPLYIYETLGAFFSRPWGWAAAAILIGLFFWAVYKSLSKPASLD